MGILEKIRLRIKRWLLGPEEPPLSILVRFPGEAKECRIIGARGMSLEVAWAGGSRIVTEAQAANSREFWKAWKHWSGNPKLYWEDGSEFLPGGD